LGGWLEYLIETVIKKKRTVLEKRTKNPRLFRRFFLNQIYMAFKKYARKVARRVGAKVKGRYFSGKGYSRPKVQKMVQDISYLKSVLNPEKKYKDTLTITPANNMYPDSPFINKFNIEGIAQGDAHNQRNGHSIKLCSLHFDAQIVQDTGTAQECAYKIYFVQVKGSNPVANSALLARFLATNPFTSQIDYWSQRNIEEFHDFRVLHVITGKMRADGITNDAPTRQIQWHKKFNQHVRWNSSNVLQEGEVFIFGVASNGVDASDNGIKMQCNCRVFYYDN